jgi:hypothetical protein
MSNSATYNYKHYKQAQVVGQQPQTPQQTDPQPSQLEAFYNNAKSVVSGYAARIPAIILAINRVMHANKIRRIPTEINQYISMASKVGMTQEARFLSQALLAEPDATRSVFARAILTYADTRAAGYLKNYNQKIPIKDLAKQILNLENEIDFAAQRAQPVEELMQQLRSLKSQLSAKDFLGIEINILENRIKFATERGQSVKAIQELTQQLNSLKKTDVFTNPKLTSMFTADELVLLAKDPSATAESLLKYPDKWRQSIRTIVKSDPTIANGKNILPLDKIAMDQANLGKGNRLLSAIEEINATVKNPALNKVTTLIRDNASHMPNVIFGVLGTILSTTDLIQHINKMRSRSNYNLSTMSEEERAQYTEDIYYFVTKCINVIGNVMLTFPPTAALGGLILGVTFAMDFAPGAAKSLGTNLAHMDPEDFLLLGTPSGQLEFFNKAKNKRYFENEQQMQAIQQQAEQNLSVAADTSDPDVQAVLTYIKGRLPLYSNGIKVNKAALMGKAIQDFLSSNEAKTWENPEKWKWLEERNANDMKYKNLTTAIAQMSKELPTKPNPEPNQGSNYPQVYNNNQFGSQAYRNTGQIQQNYIPNARYKTT